MASSFTAKALQINFDSVLEITDNSEMVSMFKTLESSGLKGFLGCPSILYERNISLIQPCFKKLENLNIEEIYAKEELVLSWDEADSTRVSLHRRMYILTKYRELLIQKFLEVRKSNFVPSDGSSATDIKVLDLLSDLHLFVLEELKEQMMVHGLTWEKTCCSKILRTMTTVYGSLVIQEGNDLWKPMPVDPSNFEVSRQLSYVDTLPPGSEFFKKMRKRWANVCIEAIEFFVYGKLLPVGSLNFCRALTIVQPVSEFGYCDARTHGVTSLG
ncbi:ATP-binding cassette transporter [Dorcoceras hygrometricum]|uniref:ATP-binding cassette transporter n=1 Tax=Dorcoceras hygrometricum TaxID=472368 RepID=A0A2Z7CMS6_9LAMI|nr:ATP-binding cassette transporter [Dorcoceras hygrometricum]